MNAHPSKKSPAAAFLLQWEISTSTLPFLSIGSFPSHFSFCHFILLHPDDGKCRAAACQQHKRNPQQRLGIIARAGRLRAFRAQHFSVIRSVNKNVRRFRLLVCFKTLVQSTKVFSPSVLKHACSVLEAMIY